MKYEINSTFKPASLQRDFSGCYNKAGWNGIKCVSTRCSSYLKIWIAGNLHLYKVSMPYIMCALFSNCIAILLLPQNCCISDKCFGGWSLFFNGEWGTAVWRMLKSLREKNRQILYVSLDDLNLRKQCSRGDYNLFLSILFDC